MFRVLVLSLCVAFTLAMPDGPPRGPPIFHQAIKCCKKELKIKSNDDKEIFQECMKNFQKPPSCEMDICFAVKKGYASAEGTIDKKALQEKVETDFANNPEALDAILENCVNGDISKYGRDDFCDLMKMSKCIEFQTLKSCDDWKDEDDCGKVKSIVEDILSKFA